MTEPTAPPANALDDARGVLHGALVEAFAVCGWPAERVDRYSPETIRTPCGWVDAPTLNRQGQGLVATFPLVVAVDGTERAQLERLDALLAAGWTALEAARLPNGSTVDVGSAGPDDVDLGGFSARAVVFSVQLPLTVRTLCPESLTRSDETP